MSGSRSTSREGYTALEDEPSTSDRMDGSIGGYSRGNAPDRLRQRPTTGEERLRTRGSSRGGAPGGSSYGGASDMQVPLLGPGSGRALPVGAPQIVTTTSSAAQPHLKRQSSAGNKAIMAMLAPQLSQTIRQRDKFVPLPLDKAQESELSRSEEDEVDEGALSATEAGPTPRQIVPRPPSSGSGRITVYCTAESLDLLVLQTRIRQRHRDWQVTLQPDDVLHVTLPPSPMHAAAIAFTAGVEGETGRNCKSLDGRPAPMQLGGGREGSTTALNSSLVQDVFFFEYGVIAFWGLTPYQEQAVMAELVKPCEVGSYPPDDVDIDEFTYAYTGHEAPSITNDVITISRRQAADHQVRLAISHALAQSTKLSVYEERVWALVEESRHLPQDLALHGRVSMPTRKLAQLIGKVFLQNSEVNLLSSVLDTPEYFWSAPDHLQGLYERVVEYLELQTRATVLNARFQVLQEMLDMLRDHKNNSHAARLEWIIIWLLCIDVVLMLFQLLSLFGFV